ncbi:hypothetical protein ACFXPS_42825 [Nocardia sp. NPDC059091]
MVKLAHHPNYIGVATESTLRQVVGVLVGLVAPDTVISPDR